MVARDLEGLLRNIQGRLGTLERIPRPGSYGQSSIESFTLDQLAAGVFDTRYYPKTSPRVNGFINGAFEFWQRGVSFASPASGSYTADRCFVDWNGTGTRTISQQAFTPGASPVAGYEGSSFYRFAQSVAGTGGTYNNVLLQKIEGVRSFAGRTVTVSFWAKADAARTVTPILIQNFGTGGSPSGAVTVNGVAQAVTTAWQRFSNTIVVPSIAGKTLGSAGNDHLILVLQSGTINATQTIDIWGIQIEEGSAATAFVRAGGDLTGEQLLCWRYYQLHDYIVGSGDSAGYKFGTNPMGQLLRATPTTLLADTKSGPTLGTTYSSNTNQAALGKGGFYNGQGATAGAFVVFTNVRIDAEL